eukprot:CAMPEP_0173079034 /NCGR_PEP_ID=MMETSP1102-20130122/14759_1 /TAXON_ID=49646 /ORGANISM="Geminigera sp., Strain Caron Lab Isolate" /LENGTH=187 /DNA_ID=CAMNT_0013950991 /DNA_START=764 /DNA_END=1325 /DNA_ORIENTATION=-
MSTSAPQTVPEGFLSDVSSPSLSLLDKDGLGMEVPLSREEEVKFRDRWQRFGPWRATNAVGTCAIDHINAAELTWAGEYLMVQFDKQMGNLAPPVGYYDVKIEFTTVLGPRLGYRVQIDHPHATTSMAEMLVKETLAKSKKDFTIKSEDNTPFQILPRVAVRLLCDKTLFVNVLSQYSLSFESHHSF